MRLDEMEGLMESLLVTISNLYKWWIYNYVVRYGLNLANEYICTMQENSSKERKIANW